MTISVSRAKPIGPPDPENEVILIGFVLDCCVMCTGQELSFRGYSVRYLVEGVDCFSGSADEKQSLLQRYKIFGWGEGIYWNEIQFVYTIH